MLSKGTQASSMRGPALEGDLSFLQGISSGKIPGEL